MLVPLLPIRTPNSKVEDKMIRIKPIANFLDRSKTPRITDTGYLFYLKILGNITLYVLMQLQLKERPIIS